MFLSVVSSNVAVVLILSSRTTKFTDIDISFKMHVVKVVPTNVFRRGFYSYRCAVLLEVPTEVSQGGAH